jgi:hypothetical protein
VSPNLPIVHNFFIDNTIEARIVVGRETVNIMERNIKTNLMKQGLFNLKNVPTYKKIKFMIFALVLFISMTIVYNMIIGSLSESWTETEGTIVRSIERSGA